MDGIMVFVNVVMIIFAVLQIILFVRVVIKIFHNINCLVKVIKKMFLFFDTV